MENNPSTHAIIPTDLPDVLTDDATGKSVETSEWMPETPEDFEFLTLQVMLCDLESQSTQAKLQAVKDHVDSVIRRINAKKQAILHRWGGLMAQHALECEKKTKKKSVVTPFGSFGHRKSQGRIEIVSQEEAMEWFKDRFPNAVAIKEDIKTSLLSDEQRNLIFSCDDDDLLEVGVRVERPGDVAYINTGLATQKITPNGYNESKAITRGSPQENET